MFFKTKRKTPQQGRPVKRQGRAYNLTLEEAEVADGVITRTILIQSIPAHVLFDSRATHSFISANFITQHHISCDDMVNPWNKAMGGSVVIFSKKCRKSPIVICGSKFLANLIVINNSAFEIVLGMDCLTTSYASLAVE